MIRDKIDMMPPKARMAQAAMDREMRIQSLGLRAYRLVREIYNAVELPPDLAADIEAIVEFVEGRK